MILECLGGVKVAFENHLKRMGTNHLICKDEKWEKGETKDQGT